MAADGDDGWSQRPPRRTDDCRGNSAASEPAGGPAGRPPGASHHVAREPFLTRTLAPFEVLNDEGLALIEHNADTILEEVGLEFRGDAEALRLLRDAGADVQGERVRFPRGMCRQIVQATAPRQFTQHARNPARQRRDRRRRTPSSPRTTARRSCATSTTAGATARSRTSGTS